MRTFSLSSVSLAALAAVVAIGISTHPAHATLTTLVFGEAGGTPSFVVTPTTATSSTLSINAMPITITTLDNVAVIDSGFLFLSASSTGAASVIGTAYLQHFSGTYAFCLVSAGSSSLGCSGAATNNYLSGSFVDLLSGITGGFAVNLAATTPPAADVTMTSGLIPASHLLPDRALSMAFAALTSPLSAFNGGTIGANTSTGAGNLSSNAAAVPEPASLAMLGTGLLVLGMVFAWRRKEDS